MSWTNECTQTNTFRTKNNEEVKEVLELLGFDVYKNKDGLQAFGSEGTYLDENTDVVLSNKPHEDIETGELKYLHGIISDYTNESVDVDEVRETYKYTDKDYVVMPLIEYLQDMLSNDKEYITCTCAGFEGRTGGDSNPYGYVEFITKTTHKAKTLQCILDEYLTTEGLI